MVVSHCYQAVSPLGAGCPTGILSPQATGTVCPNLAVLARTQRWAALESKSVLEDTADWDSRTVGGTAPVMGILLSVTLACTVLGSGGHQVLRKGLALGFRYPRTLLGPKTGTQPCTHSVRWPYLTIPELH